MSFREIRRSRPEGPSQRSVVKVNDNLTEDGDNPTEDGDNPTEDTKEVSSTPEQVSSTPPTPPVQAVVPEAHQEEKEQEPEQGKAVVPIPNLGAHLSQLDNELFPDGLLPDETEKVTVYMTSAMKERLQEYCTAFTTRGKNRQGQPIPENQQWFFRYIFSGEFPLENVAGMKKFVGQRRWEKVQDQAQKQFEQALLKLNRKRRKIEGI